MKPADLKARIEELEQILDIERAAYELVQRENTELRETVRRLQSRALPRRRTHHGGHDAAATL